MKNTRYKPNKKGFVLSLVLWISAAMMLLSLLFVRMSKEQSEIYAKMHQKLGVEIRTQSLFEKISFYIATGKFESNKVLNILDNFPSSLYIDAKEYNITKKDSTCVYSLFDHSGLYNLRFLLADNQAQKIIQQISSKKYPLNDVYLDWLDRDDFSRLNGAEKSDYLLNGYGYIPSNYMSFQHKESLSLLKDFDKFDKNITVAILKHFTTYGSTPINIALFDKEILNSFFPQLDKNQLSQLLTLRDKNFKAYRKEFSNSHISQDYYSTFASKIITIDIKCSKNNLISKLKAVVNFRTTNSRSWAILEMQK